MSMSDTARAFFEACETEKGLVQFDNIQVGDCQPPRSDNSHVISRHLTCDYLSDVLETQLIIPIPSLRAGLVTTLAERGRTEVKIMRQSRHKSSAMVRTYTRPLDAKQGCPLRGAF